VLEREGFGELAEIDVKSTLKRGLTPTFFPIESSTTATGPSPTRRSSKSE
jgi:hypothetical protein